MSVSGTETLSEQLAAWSCGLSFEDIPEKVLEDLCWHSLDTLGVMLSASSLEYARGLSLDAVSESTAHDATLFGDGRKVAERSAVFVNGSLGHGIDWDDTHLEALLHPTATILPVVLAIAESRKFSGRQLLVALTAGIEAMSRVGLASGHGLVKRGLHPTSMCGTFGSAVAASHMFGLDQKQTANSLGIAGGMCAGLHESVIDGSMNKCIHSGIAAQAGYASAELAEAGFEGPAAIFEGQKGYFNAFAGEDNCEAAALTYELGRKWEAGRLAYKTYACCQGTHPYADVALELFHQKNVRAENVASILVKVGEKVGKSLCEPADVKCNPPSAYGAKFSIPFVVATALTDGKVTLDSFTDEALGNPIKRRLAQSLEYVIDPYYDVGMALRGFVEVRLTDGRKVIRKTDACTGTPENPWSNEGVAEKFHLLADPAIGRERANNLVDIVAHLTDLYDMRELTRNLVTEETAAHYG